MKKIQKGIKPPVNKNGFYVRIAENMEVDDSVLMESTSEASKVCDALRRKGFEATQKKEAKGCRVWRTK